MNKIRAVFWDNDGTLVDTEGLFFEATANALAREGVTVTREMFIEYSLRTGRSLFELVPPEKLEPLRDLRDVEYEAGLQGGITPLPHVEPLLRDLRGRVTLAVVTTSWRRNLEAMHRPSGLLKHFDFTIAFDDCTKYKPDPQPYRKALERAGCAADEALAVEDSERGLRSAQAAGISCIVVTNALSRAGAFDGAHSVFSGMDAGSEEIRRLVGL